jgi:hypothetical protein
MNEITERALTWVPRGLAVALGLFLAVFALDVFEEGAGLGRTAAALLIHLVPTALILAILAVAWSHERAGAFLYLILALFSLWFFRASPVGQVITAGPLFVLSALFLWSAHRHHGAHA